MGVSCSIIMLDDRIIDDKSPLPSWQSNCVAYATELCQLRWTPIRPMPSSGVGFVSNGTEDSNVIEGRRYYEPNVEVQGIPYSNAGEYGRNIGSDVRIETFMTALKNPNSVAYTLDTRDVAPSNLTSCYYGNNCSSFTNLLQNIPVLCFGRNCNFGGNRRLEYPQTIEDAQIGDMLYLQKTEKDCGHAILILGITRVNGEIVSIRTVEERPYTNAEIIDYSKQAFIKAFFYGGRGYEFADIYRNDGIVDLHSYEAFNEADYLYSQDIGLNLGNNTNYDKEDSIPIEVTLLSDVNFELLKDGINVESHLSTEGKSGFGNTLIITIDKSVLDCGLYEVRPSAGVSQYFCLTSRGTASATTKSDGSVLVYTRDYSSNITPYGVIFFSDSSLKTTRGMYEMGGNALVQVPAEFMERIDTYGDIKYAMIAYRNEYGNVYSEKVQILKANH